MQYQQNKIHNIQFKIRRMQRSRKIGNIRRKINKLKPKSKQIQRIELAEKDSER